MKLAIPTLFGLEGLTAEECRFYGFEDVSADNGRVTFTGDFAEIAEANLRVRTGERVLIELAEFPASSFEDLFQGTSAICWELWIGRKDAFPVKGWSLNSVLHSVPDCQSIIKKAIVDRLGSRYHIQWFEETGSKVQIQFSIMKDIVTIYLDTTGPGLHKRGYRADANAAPLRETLAAGMCDLARVRKSGLVVDPMCGSGTILIEAAMQATGRAPGLMRRFSCEKWSCFPEDIFPESRRRLQSMIRKPDGFEAVGYDIDPKAVELTRSNAKKAHVEDLVHVNKVDLRDLNLPKGPLILISNPPYGERMLDIAQARELYGVLGEKCVPDPERSYCIISSDDEFENHFGRKAPRRRKLYNGMLKCQYYMYIHEKATSGGKTNGKRTHA
jgi:putative N6-adenine-specific DNA methylase